MKLSLSYGLKDWKIYTENLVLNLIRVDNRHYPGHGAEIHAFFKGWTHKRKYPYFSTATEHLHCIHLLATINLVLQRKTLMHGLSLKYIYSNNQFIYKHCFNCTLHWFITISQKKRKIGHQRQVLILFNSFYSKFQQWFWYYAQTNLTSVEKYDFWRTGEKKRLVFILTTIHNQKFSIHIFCCSAQTYLISGAKIIFERGKYISRENTIFCHKLKFSNP